MISTLEAAYIGIGATDPAAVARYLGDVVGLMPGEPVDGAGADGAASTWRVDRKARRVFIERAARDDAVCIGFEAPSAAAFEATVKRLEQTGARITPMNPGLCAMRGVERGVSMDTPWGVPLELVTGLADSATPFASAHFPDGFVTGQQGFGHFVFAVATAAEYDASRRFAIEGLGLKLSDWLRMPRAEGEMHVSFLHCNARHHSLAIALVPGASPIRQRLNHINFEVADVSAVGAAFERALRAGASIANTIGQHANDGMVSFYSISPGGWRVEIGATGRTIGDDWNDVREYDRISNWGHQPPHVLAGMLSSNPLPGQAS